MFLGLSLSILGEPIRMESRIVILYLESDFVN